MAGSLASINIRFAVDLASLSTGLQNAARSVESVGKKFTAAGQTLTVGLTAPLLGLGVASLKTFGDLEALRKGLISVMGSASAAEAEFEKLKEVAKLPGLGLEEAVRGSVNLQAAGFSADEARESLLAFGNALATVGKGKRELDLVTLALTQLNNKSSGFGQDLRQLTEQLPQLRGALTEAFGTADSEAIAKTGVTGKQVVQLLTKEFAKLPKVTGGFNNALENTSDSLKLTLASVGEAINKAFDVEGLLNTVAEKVADVAAAFNGLDPFMQKVVLSTAAIAAAIGPVLLGIGGLLKIVPLLSAGVTALSTSFAFLSANIVPIVAILGVAFLAYKALQSETVKLTAAQETLNNLDDEAVKLLSTRKAKITELVRVARDETKSVNGRRDAIAQLNAISPQYLGNLTLETINTSKATEALNKYNTALLQSAKAKAADSLLGNNLKKQAEAYAQFEIKLQQIAARQGEVLFKGQKTFKDVQKTAFETSKANIAARESFNGIIVPLQKEEVILRAVYERFKAQLGLLDDNTAAAGAMGVALGDSFKAGTIAAYEAQIKKLKELQTEFETTPEAIAILEDRIVKLQGKIDTLNGKRIVITSVLEGEDAIKPIENTIGSLSDFNNQISELEKLQSEVLTTSDLYRELAYQITLLENKKNAITNVFSGISSDANIDGSYEIGSLADLDSQIETLTALQSTVAKTSLEFAGLGESISKLQDQKDTLTGLSDAAQQFSQSINSAFKEFYVGAVETFATAIGEMAAGKAKLGDVFAGIAGLIGDFVTNIGKSLVAVGVAGIAFQNSLSNPYAALVAGAVVIAVGAAFKAAVGSFNDAGAYTNGGIIPGGSFSGDRLFARVNSGEMILNEQQQRNIWNMINPAVTAADVTTQLTGEFRLQGDDLALALRRNAKKRNRTN